MNGVSAAGRAFYGSVQAFWPVPRAIAGLGFRLQLLEQLTPAEHAVACSLVAGFSHAQSRAPIRKVCRHTA